MRAMTVGDKASESKRVVFGPSRKSFSYLDRGENESKSLAVREL